jgi:hypothetical protein
MFMKIRMLAIVAALLAGAGLSRADITSADIWSNNTNVMTCSYDPVVPVSGSPGNYLLSIYGTQLAWAAGSIGGTITTDGTDPTLQLGEQINNDTGSTWNDYHVTITMSQSFSFSNVGVTNGGWTDIVTAPTLVGSDWIGYVDYYAGTPVLPDNSILDFSLSVTFTGNTSFEETLMPSTVPEPGTFALMVCGLTGLLVMRRRSAMK